MSPREKALRRDGYRCRLCKTDHTLHVHHIIYRSHGGPNASWNLVTLCLNCHEAIHKKFTVIAVPPNADKGVKFSVKPGWIPGTPPN